MKKFFKVLKNIVIILFIIIAIIDSIFLIFCFKNLHSIENKISVLQNSDKIIVSTDLPENDAYKMMYENLKYNNDKMVDTVYWALSGLDTLR